MTKPANALGAPGGFLLAALFEAAEEHHHPKTVALEPAIGSGARLTTCFTRARWSRTFRNLLHVNGHVFVLQILNRTSVWIPVLTANESGIDDRFARRDG